MTKTQIGPLQIVTADESTGPWEVSYKGRLLGEVRRSQGEYLFFPRLGEPLNTVQLDAIGDVISILNG